MKISEAESVVMEVLWRSGEAAADDIAKAVAAEQDWKSATIKTLLNRLLNKGAISAEQEGRRFIYSAAISRNDYVLERGKGLINRFFDGRVAPFVSQFSEEEPLSKEDIKELRKLIDRLEDES